MAQVYTVYSADYRLLLAVSDEPGIFNFAKMPEDGVEPVECEFATIQVYDVSIEPDALNALGRSGDLEEFLDRLRDRGLKVIDGRPQPGKFARL